MWASACKHGLLFLCVFVSSVLHAGGQLLQKDTINISSHFEKKWSDLQSEIVWSLSEDGYPDSDMANTEIQAIIESAFNVWEQVPTSTITFNYGGEVPYRNAAIDGINLISFADQDFVFDPGAMAMTILYTFTHETIITDSNNDLNGDGVADLVNGVYPAGTIYEADIVFNTSYDFSNAGINGSLDLYAIALHEIGHFAGLSHSLISDAVMYPYLSNDITSARIPKLDDVAYISSIYPKQPELSNIYGSVSGNVRNGFDNSRILGAHVFALNPETGQKVIGAYSLEQGQYNLPGLPSGEYFIGIEPLDSNPIAEDPNKINEVIANTSDTNFIPEFYDSNESNIETNSQNAEPVTIVSGSIVANIDLITNTDELPGVSLLLYPGLNLFSYPVETYVGFTAFDLLTALGGSTEVNSIDRYDRKTGRYQRASWLDGMPDGENFPIIRGEAYIVHMSVQKQVVFKGGQDCVSSQLHSGFNLIGITCPPAGYSAFDALEALGHSVRKIVRYNQDQAVFEEAYYDSSGALAGNDFIVVNGEGYVVETIADQDDIMLPGQSQLFPPFLSGVSPGRGVVGASITITGQGFSEEIAENDVRINGVRASIGFASASQIHVQVPPAATSGLVTVAIDGMTSNGLEFIVEPSLINENELDGDDVINGQTINGELISDGDVDRFTFIATKGAFVNVSAISAITGVPDLILAIEGPTGGILISDDDSGGGTNPLISKFEIPQTGRYTIIVTSVANTGTGQYSVSLDIENRSTVPTITILKGDYQTGLMGSQLPDSLEVFVSGSTGEGVAGASVTLVSSDSVNISESFTASTYTLTTNAGGIVNVNLTLPDIPGEYSISIQVPGYEAQIITVASLTRMPAQIIVENNNQDCDGAGCIVNQWLPRPYTLTFLDSNSQPLEGVLVKFDVVSGDGEIEGDFLPNVSGMVLRTNEEGKVSIRHKLGRRTVKDDGSPVQQIVSAVANISNGTGPILLTSIPRADIVSSIESLKSDHIQMMVGVRRYQAIYVVVKDAYGNPVPGAEVTIDTSDLSYGPGILFGSLLTEMKTNSDGRFAAKLIADIEGPTRNEFGQPLGGKEPYVVNMSIGGVTKSYLVDVNLGPALVIVNRPDETLSVNDDVQIGQQASLPIVFAVMRYRREDSCLKHPDYSYDVDCGNWTNENVDVDLIELVREDASLTPDLVNTDALEFNWDIQRVDGEIGTGLTAEPMTVSGGRKGEYLALNVNAGNEKGSILVNVTANLKLGAEHTSSIYCMRDHDSSEYRYSTSNTDPLMQIGMILPSLVDMASRYACTPSSDPGCDWDAVGGGCQQQSYGFVRSQIFTASFPFNAIAPLIEVELSEPDIAETQQNTLPSKLGYSGLDLSDYEISLNSSKTFNLSDLPQLNTFPNYVQISIDGNAVVDRNHMSIDAISPKTFKFSFYPEAQDLVTGELNVVSVDVVRDKSGNSETNDNGTPRSPDDFEFSFP